MATPVTPKYHKISKQVLHQYQEQVETLQHLLQIRHLPKNLTNPPEIRRFSQSKRVRKKLTNSSYCSKASVVGVLILSLKLVESDYFSKMSRKVNIYFQGALEVTFLCKDGQQMCSRRQLGQSDYFWDKAGKMDEFGNALKFDYTKYSWAAALGLSLK